MGIWLYLCLHLLFMGYYIFSYAVDAERIKGVIGTKDPALFEQVLETEEFDNYSEQDFAGHTGTREALEQMILGKRHSLLGKYNKKSGHAYWYALIAICAALGERLDATHEIKLSYETDLINDYLRDDFAVRLKIEEVLLPGDDGLMGLPEPADFPMVGLLLPERLAALQKTFAPIEISDADLERLQEEDDEKEMAYDSIRQIKMNIDHCVEKGLSLLSFCH